MREQVTASIKTCLTEKQEQELQENVENREYRNEILVPLTAKRRLEHRIVRKVKMNVASADAVLKRRFLIFSYATCVKRLHFMLHNAQLTRMPPCTAADVRIELLSSEG